MKIYSLDTEFAFGKFTGKTLQEVLATQPTYIQWCLLKLDHFCITSDTMREISNMYSGFSISADAEKKRMEKEAQWVLEQAAEDNDEDDSDCELRHHYSEEELEMGDWDYNPMNPAHDPSDNPWIDVFGPGDEAEAAYWNTD